jgi:uncharacterized LabA/DUF88 family protein
MTERIAVFLDYQNVLQTGHGLYGVQGARDYENAPHPVRLAELIAERRARPSEAAAIRVYRGQPVSTFQPRPAATYEAQMSHWTRDARVHVHSRPLRYPGWTVQNMGTGCARPMEKGIDVALAVDLMHLAMRKQYDALVLFSSDTDLLPAIETIVGARMTHLEVACWRGGPRLRLARTEKPWCHLLTRDDWRSVGDDWSGKHPAD